MCFSKRRLAILLHSEDRFGSVATDAFRANFEQCPVRSVSDQNVAAPRTQRCANRVISHRSKAAGFSAVSDEPPYGARCREWPPSTASIADIAVRL